MSVFEPVQAYLCSPEGCDDGWHLDDPEKRPGWYIDSGDLIEFQSFDCDAFLIPSGEGVTVKEIEVWIFPCDTRWVGPLEPQAAWKCKECGQIVGDPEDGCGCA